MAIKSSSFRNRFRPNDILIVGREFFDIIRFFKGLNLVEKKQPLFQK